VVQALRLLTLALLTSVLLPASAHATVSSAFTQSLYGSGVATTSTDGTVIDVPARPGGARWRADLDPVTEYRIELDGHRSDGGMVLRITTDAGHTYLRAPHGRWTMRVSDTRSVEILVFSHYPTDATTYRVDGLTISECGASCPDDGQLRQQILAERPLLQAALDRGDELAAATELLRWASPRIPAAANVGTQDLGIANDDLSAAEIFYDRFGDPQLGVFCGGAAAALQALLDLFGIDAFQFAFGDPAVYTHVVVVIRVERPGMTSWHMLDPTFNLRLRLARGADLPLLEAAELWRAGRFDLVELDTAPLGARTVIVGHTPDGDPIRTRCDAGAFVSEMCDLEQNDLGWRDTFIAAGHGTGYAATFSLMAKGTLFYPDKLGVPAAFRDAHHRLKTAVTEGHADMHVADLPLVPAVIEPPRILGSPQVGERLVALPGSWDLEPGRWDRSAAVRDPANPTVTWYRCSEMGCKQIPGAAGLEYVATAADTGQALAVGATAANRWGAAPTIMSSHTELITAAPPGPAPPPGDVTSARTATAAPSSGAARTRRRPAIRGTARVGRSLRCTVAGGSRIRWTRSGRRIHRVIGRTYRVRSRDSGRLISCSALVDGKRLRSASVRVRRTHR
jgi:hypothetical protein